MLREHPMGKKYDTLIKGDKGKIKELKPGPDEIDKLKEIID